ncbi:MAG: hypothetical protein Q9183_004968 [Haloplaca sp. 2 TL-2023]
MANEQTTALGKTIADLKGTPERLKDWQMKFLDKPTNIARPKQTRPQGSKEDLLDYKNKITDLTTLLRNQLMRVREAREAALPYSVHGVSPPTQANQVDQVKMSLEATACRESFDTYMYESASLPPKMSLLKDHVVDRLLDHDLDELIHYSADKVSDGAERGS